LRNAQSVAGRSSEHHSWPLPFLEHSKDGLKQCGFDLVRRDLS
jgi:hypothetical protein